jgi:hypothetical protein
MATTKLTPGAKVTVTGPTEYGQKIKKGTVVYAVRYMPSSESWHVSKKKGGPGCASIKRKNLAPVTSEPITAEVTNVEDLKVGDKVKVAKKGACDAGSSSIEGCYGVVVTNDRSRVPFGVKMTTGARTGERFWFTTYGNLLKVVDTPKATEIKSKTGSKYEVDSAFIKEAYKAACPEWKAKLEAKYPELLKPTPPKPKRLKFTDKDGGVVYNLSSIATKSLFVGVGLAPAGQSGECLMMRKSELTPKITERDGYWVITFEVK